MTTPPTIGHMLNREPTRRGANEFVLVLGVAAFMFGMALVTRGVLLSPPAAHLVRISHAALGQVERRAPAQDESPVAMTPQTDPVPLTLATSPASSGTQAIAVCPP